MLSRNSSIKRVERLISIGCAQVFLVWLFCSFDHGRRPTGDATGSRAGHWAPSAPAPTMAGARDASALPPSDATASALLPRDLTPWGGATSCGRTRREPSGGPNCGEEPVGLKLKLTAFVCE
jgi:hypothetical protein